MEVLLYLLAPPPTQKIGSCYEVGFTVTAPRRKVTSQPTMIQWKNSSAVLIRTTFLILCCMEHSLGIFNVSMVERFHCIHQKVGARNFFILEHYLCRKIRTGVSFGAYTVINHLLHILANPSTGKFEIGFCTHSSTGKLGACFYYKHFCLTYWANFGRSFYRSSSIFSHTNV